MLRGVIFVYLSFLTPHVSKPTIDCKNKGLNIVCEQLVLNSHCIKFLELAKVRNATSFNLVNSV